MKALHEGQIQFYSEISEHQISANEFFSSVLLDSLNKNFGWQKAVISYFDTEGKFLSWTSWKGIELNHAGHPYQEFMSNDIVRYQIHEEAVRDHLTYFNVVPRLYKSTDSISEEDYETSGFVRFLEKNFECHYSVTMAFGINAYIQISFMKSKSDGDFTEDELKELNEIYVYVANAYKNFKKYEQAKIVADIQNEVIASGEKAYLVTDDFMHILSCNTQARKYLEDILGTTAANQISSTVSCSWLPFLLGSEDGTLSAERVQMRVIKGHVFKIYTYDQVYSNGIVDRYHWITITPSQKEKSYEPKGTMMSLTPAECRVAELLDNGLTYQAIANELVVSYHTIKKHVQNIYLKCGVNSRYELHKWMENQ